MITRAVIRTRRFMTLPELASEADFLLAFGMAALADSGPSRGEPWRPTFRPNPTSTAQVGYVRNTSSTQDGCGRRVCANTGHSPKGLRTGAIDPLLSFRIDPVNGR